MTTGKTSKNIGVGQSKFLLVGIALITLGMFTNFYDPFNTPKLILLIVLGTLTLSHLAAHIVQFGIFPHKFDKILFLLSLLFLLGLIVSTLSSEVITTSLIGDTQRRNGFLQYFALLIIFVYAYRVFNISMAKQLIKLAILISFVLSLYGFMQITGRDFIAWNNPYNSMISTLGNPNFASALLAVFLVILVIQFNSKEISRSFKLLSLASAIMSGLAIFYSDSRQGLLTFAIGIAVYIVISVYYKNRKYGVIIAALTIVLFIFSVLGMLQSGPFAKYLYKDSISVRGFYWRAAIEMMKANPLTGVGLDRYGYYFKSYREPEYSLSYGYQINSNNAHNVYLQFFSTGGLLLGLSYLLLCGVTVFVAAKLLKSLDSEIRYTTLTLFSAWVALQAQSLISIDSIGISIWIWVLGGAIIGLGRNQLVFKKDVLEQQSIKSKTLLKSEIYQKVYLVLLLIPTAMISYLLFQSEVDTYKSKFFTVPSATQNQSVVQDFSDQVLSNSLSDPQYKLFVTINLFEMGLKLEAYKQVNEQLNADPHNLDILNTLVFMTADLKKVEDTILIRERIAKLDPFNAENHLALLKFYQESGNLVRANFNYDKIMSFAQNTEIAAQAKKILER